ncbi:MAG: phosphoglycerate dehydrogenase [Actinomycetota bacterium]|nr:phosphoglycerate dehydrogenase [Actinomycetota bacterium]
MARILVTEEIAESGLDLLRADGHLVDVQLGLSAEELLRTVPGAEGLIIRSATKVTQEVIDAATDLVVIGRAGIGLDNVDVNYATQRGVMVVNAPQSNILSAAELTIALLLAQARNVPQAHTALVNGKWERSKWEGVELYGKFLGIVGLGRIGTLVAQRALAFGMKLVAYDPYIAKERARQMGVELMDLDELMSVADFVTVHLPKSKETAGLIGKEALAKAKPNARIINVARGGIVDEEALYEAISAGRLGGAALDVFTSEPCTTSPLFELPSVVVTPHLGASTTEAQDKAGVTIAEQLRLAFAGDFVPFAVNVNAAEVPEQVKPYLPVAEALGRFLGSLEGGLPDSVEIEYQGQLAGGDTRLLKLSVMKGIFGAGTNEPVSYVNAPQIAAERGLEVRESFNETSKDYVSLLTLTSPHHQVSATVAGASREARIVIIDGHRVEIPPAQYMLVVRNDDAPGKIGLVGSILGDAGYSISSMAVGPSDDGATALMVLSLSAAATTEVMAQISAAPGIIYARAVSCSA